MKNSGLMINMREAFGENLLAPEEGERLRLMIHDDLIAERNVELDFAGVRIVASAFLNTGIGRLYEDVPESAIREHLSVPNLSDVGRFALKRVVENAKRYFTDSAYRAAADAVQVNLLEA